jgi:hypothetical protein
LGFAFGGGAAVRLGAALVGSGLAVERGAGAEDSTRRGRSRLAFLRSGSGVDVAVGLGDGDGDGVAVALSWIGAGVLEPPAPPTSAIASAATAMQLAMVRV